MGYNFDVTKMPADMQVIFYQAAVKSGDKTKIDSELEYSLFMSGAKNLMNSGKASFSKDVYDDIFNIKIYQNVTPPTEKEVFRTVKHISGKEQNVEVEKIDKDLYRYTITIGDLKKLDYTQQIGTVKKDENSCISGGKTYTFYKNGSMEISDTKQGKSVLYDTNDSIIE